MLHRDAAAGYAAKNNLEKGEYGVAVEWYGAIIGDNNIMTEITEDEESLSHMLYMLFEQGKWVSNIYMRTKWVKMDKYTVEQARIGVEFKKDLLTKYIQNELELISANCGIDRQAVIRKENESYSLVINEDTVLFSNKYFPLVYKKWWAYLKNTIK